MFGNCFFPQFSVFKNNFLFPKAKNLFGNFFWTKIKNYFQFSYCEGNWKQVLSCFYFSVFPHFRKHGENTLKRCQLMNQRIGSTLNTNKMFFLRIFFFFTQVFSAVSDTLYIRYDASTDTLFLCTYTTSILPKEEKTLIERTKVWVFSLFLCWCWVCALNRVYTMHFCSIWFSGRIGFQRFYSTEQNFLRSICP